MSLSAGATLRELRERKPLVHQITNYVVMNETANATLALGGLPVMAHAPQEVEEMVGLASALVLNIGTLSEHWIEAMLAAGRAASLARAGGSSPVAIDSTPRTSAFAPTSVATSPWLPRRTVTSTSSRMRWAVSVR